MFLFAADGLGIKELVPAYLDPNLKAEDLLTGVSFASGGCGFDPRTAALMVCACTLTFEVQTKTVRKSCTRLNECTAS